MKRQLTLGQQKEEDMKNVFAFVAGGAVALAGVLLGNGIKTASETPKK